MREFFRGWKRKLGVLTLILACVFTAAGIRSLAIHDAIVLSNRVSRSKGVAIIERLVATKGRLYLERFQARMPLVLEYGTVRIRRTRDMHGMKSQGWIDFPYAYEEIAPSNIPPSRPTTDMETRNAIDFYIKGIEREPIHPIKWRFIWCGFGYGECEHSYESARLFVWTMSYWSIVLPLIALSACLLLSKPRQPSKVPI